MLVQDTLHPGHFHVERRAQKHLLSRLGADIIGHGKLRGLRIHVVHVQFRCSLQLRRSGGMVRQLSRLNCCR